MTIYFLILQYYLQKVLHKSPSNIVLSENQVNGTRRKGHDNQEEGESENFKGIGCGVMGEQKYLRLYTEKM